MLARTPEEMPRQHEQAAWREEQVVEETRMENHAFRATVEWDGKVS